MALPKAQAASLHKIEEDGDLCAISHPLESPSSVAPIVNVKLEVEEAPSPIRSKTRLYAILLGVYTSLFLGALDVTIISTAIPTIASDLKSASGYTWIGGAYLLANAASAPIWAKLSDIFGRKVIFLAAVGLFFSSSILCALSSSMSMLIAGRSLQGIGGGGIFQLVSILISDLFSMRQRTIYFSLMEVIWALASGVGPVLGGVFSQKVGWRWIFWINLPLSGIVFLLILFFLNVHNPRTPLIAGLKALDWAGTLTIVGLTLMLLLGLEFGGATFPWNSPRVICLIIFGSLMALLFIWCEKKLAKYPLMPLELFSNRSTIGCMLVDFCHAFTFVSAEYFLPLYLQSVLGASPLRSGILVIPLVMCASGSGLMVGFYIHRTGQYIPIIWVGTIMLCIGQGLYILFTATSSVALIAGLECIGGLAAGLLFQPPLIGLQAHVRQDDIATATATYGFVREIASAIGIVIGGVVFQNSMTLRSADLRAAGASPETVAQFVGSNAAANAAIVKTIADNGVRMAVKEAFAFALRNMWIFYTGIAFFGILATFLITHKTLSEHHEETKTGIKEKEER